MGYFQDINDTFSTAQAVTVTAMATNCIPTPASATNPVVSPYNGASAPYVSVIVGTAATAVGDATVDIEVVTADTEANLAASTNILAGVKAVPKATLVAGYRVDLRLPEDGFRAVYGVRYTVATGPLTAGTFTSFVAPTITVDRTYVDASAIL